MLILQTFILQLREDIVFLHYLYKKEDFLSSLNNTSVKKIITMSLGLR